MLSLTNHIFRYKGLTCDRAVAYLLDADLTEPLESLQEVSALAVGTISYTRIVDQATGLMRFESNEKSLFNSPVIGDVIIGGVNYIAGKGIMSSPMYDIDQDTGHQIYTCSNRLDLLGFTTQDLASMNYVPASAGDLLVDLNGECTVTSITGIANEEIVLSALMGDTWTELGPLPLTLDSVVMSKLRIVKSDGTRISEVPIIFVEGQHVVPKTYNVRTVAVSWPLVLMTDTNNPIVCMSSGLANDALEVPARTLNPKPGTIASLIHIPDLDLLCMESTSNVIK